MEGINIIKICAALLEEVQRKNPKLQKSSDVLNQSEEKALNSFLDYINAYIADDSFEEEELMEFDEGFSFGDDWDYQLEEMEEIGEMQPSSQSSGQSWDDFQIEGEPREKFTFEYMAKVVECYDNEGWKKVQARFKKVKHQHYVYRFRKYLDSNGTKIEKFQKLNLHVKDMFANAHQNYLPVHEMDLRRWGVQRARELCLDFQASATWVLNFKRKHGIVSRKITKYLTLKEATQQKDIDRSADIFVSQVKSEIDERCYSSDQILNTDQSGHEYEPASTRTLSIRGEKTTKVRVQSKNSNTHSHTVQPIITMSGELVGKLLITLQERDGKLGPTVTKKLNIPENVYLSCSKSGKLDKSIVKLWVTNCLKPAIKSDTLLLVDSWGGQKDADLYTEVQNQCRIKTIPPLTTGKIQPLDVYFFRQAKNFRKKMRDRILIDQLDLSIHDRQRVINQHSLIHNQLQSPKFKRMIQYAWFKSGYLKEDPRPFKNVNEVCFQNIGHECQVQPVSCTRSPFLRCSHCEIVLCLEHFLEDFHYHQL